MPPVAAANSIVKYCMELLNIYGCHFFGKIVIFRLDFAFGINYTDWDKEGYYGFIVCIIGIIHHFFNYIIPVIMYFYFYEQKDQASKQVLNFT